MLPATLPQEVKHQLLHYLEATFPMRNAAVEAALGRFFNDPANGLFKGPWVQLRKPFRQASSSGEQFFNLKIPFTPFKHQWQAWQRLTSKDNHPKPTIVTTGTGSGKTECFLYPILDHCLRQQAEGKNNGIKAIILYPMNALAADQAGRFAEEILKSDQLSYNHAIDGKTIRKARIRVGLYTGRMQPGQDDKSGDEPGTYKEVQIIPGSQTGGKPAYVSITNRQTMQANPPDILLTNYKMLDYLLMRPKDQEIWRFNSDDATLLQYLVLDELHTYDGAQGADVACLIRRLKERLSLAKGQLCVMGTSATIASGEDEGSTDPIDRLCDFAKSLFEEDFQNDAVIVEDRYSVAEIVRPIVNNAQLPTALQCEPGDKETAEEFARRIAPLFGGPEYPVAENDPWLAKVSGADKCDDTTRWGLALGEWLRTQSLFHLILKATDGGAVEWNEMIRLISRDDFPFREVGDLAARGQVLMAFLALVAQSRELRSGRAFPLVPTQVQLWLRELRRISMIVAFAPVFHWLDEPLAEKRQLPAMHCTECGEAAWVALVDPDQTSVIQQTVNGFGLIDDPQKIYQGWGFEHQPSDRLVTISPWPEGDDPLIPDGQQKLPEFRHYLAPTTLVIRTGPGPCPLSGEATFPVKVAHESTQNQNNGQRYGIRKCPHCQSIDSLMFIGSRAATVASVAIDEVFGSTLNNDPKLLAFTDSVQDASHRAGFFSARTYNFTFRTALKHIIDDAGISGLPINEVGDRLLSYWSENRPGRPGSLREVMSTLIPPDLREYSEYLDFRNNPTLQIPPAKLRKDFVERLTWQAVSEFSLMMTHGRTMELHASATLGWDQEVIKSVISKLRSRLPGISPSLTSIDDKKYELWIYGMLHRSRERGALYHSYFDSYARQSYWGKFPFGRVVAGRETYPAAGKYKPHLIVTDRDRYHDYVLAPRSPGQMAPWQLVWARRVLGAGAVDDSTLIDLIKVLLDVGVEAGLFLNLHVDGSKSFYALNSAVARLYSAGEKIACTSSGTSLYRPDYESSLWINSPSLGYRDDLGTYQPALLNERERYYRDRYRKGALRRVFAFEHTGLLTTEEREALEMSFNSGGHADDPNVLTATSTLEMGIDIGDLSTTMLCSIPPTVASYLQRIGRAGRSTGTALVMAVINQRPHDLFFFARPHELLNGSVEPPGCWLDANAVLVRQYLAYCFDSAVKQKILIDLPATGKQLVDEVIVNHAGHIPGLIFWMASHEAELQQDFLVRFKLDVKDDTKDRFFDETRTEKLRERIEQAAAEFNSQRQLLRNAGQRLNEQKKKIDASIDPQALAEIEREQKILTARIRKLGEISALEVLIEHGLLPNYAFPERGVRFSGTTYNQYGAAKEDRMKSYEIVRSGSSAIRELAPGNHFYTHSHVFDIQQLEIGSKTHQLLEEWSVCGQCGHMRTVSDVTRLDAVPACPQCGYDGPEGQTDVGQHRACLPFHRSQAVSYMEYYDSLSSDKGEERENELYRLAVSFDNTVAQAIGAVGDDDLPFGIEYRAAIYMREINAGYRDQIPQVAFGVDVKVPDGFEVCAGCGMAVMPGGQRSGVSHRKSCPGRTRTAAMQQEGKTGDAYQWQQTWLYRELRSEAIRLLLPDVDREDLDTLEASIYLGMRIRFQGDPAHLMVRPQVIPDHRNGVTRHFLVLMDAVPGGTGFLKALYQEADEHDRAAEGMMNVMRLALNALETCECRRLNQTDNDTDGCYRCIRTYHMQHRSTNISRERGIRLLQSLITAGMKRTTREALDDIKTEALFGSVLEKKFVERLKEWVEGLHGQWHETLINGNRGFRFVLGSPEKAWELELQPLLGSCQGVSIACQPDFMLRCDDASVKPVAIFADGFEPHVHPGDADSRLTDDVQKRRAILESGQYWVWNISWDDIASEQDSSNSAFLHDYVVDRLLRPHSQRLAATGVSVPNIAGVTGNAWQQMKAFIICPYETIWQALAEHTAGFPLVLLAGAGIGTESSLLQASLSQWMSGYNPPPLASGAKGDWCWATKIAVTEDLMAYSPVNDAFMANQFDHLKIGLRLEDSATDRSNPTNYRARWRRFMSLFNFFQFTKSFNIFTTSEVLDGTAPVLDVSITSVITADWGEVVASVVASLIPLAKMLAVSCCAVPVVEYYDDDLEDELFAEMAWPDSVPPVAVLTGDQSCFAGVWQNAGWVIVTDKDIQAKGLAEIASMIPKAEVKGEI